MLWEAVGKSNWVIVLRIFQPDQTLDASAALNADIERAVAELNAAREDDASLLSRIIKPCSLHDSRGRVLYLNQDAAELLGLGNCDQAGAFIDALHVHDRVAVANFLVDTPAVSGLGDTIECRLQRAQTGKGETLWLELGKYGFRGRDSGHAFTLVTWRDITQAKRNELNALAVQEKTEEANMAKSRFLASISHELRTPLNAILGFSELLNSPLAVSFDEVKRIEYIDLIHDSAKHLLNLLNSILDMSKIENGMYELLPESFDIAKCVENCAAIMSGQAGPRGIRIACQGLEDLPHIVGDERAVRQVIINLLSNAIKFSHDGGLVNVNATRSARSVELVIRDHGVGISPEHLKNLGKPFFQADSKYDRKFEGTGLGLSIVQGLVALHNGTTHIESVRGSGTSITVSLPINCKPAKQVPGRETPRKIHALPKTQQIAGQAVSHDLKVLRNTA